MHVVFSVCIVRCGAVGACVWEMRSVSLCRYCMVVLCASCALHDMQFVNAGRGCKRRPYGRGILQSRSYDYLVGSHECLLLGFYYL